MAEHKSRKKAAGEGERPNKREQGSSDARFEIVPIPSRWNRPRRVSREQQDYEAIVSALMEGDSRSPLADRVKSSPRTRTKYVSDIPLTFSNRSVTAQACGVCGRMVRRGENVTYAWIPPRAAIICGAHSNVAKQLDDILLAPVPRAESASVTSTSQRRIGKPAQAPNAFLRHALSIIHGSIHSRPSGIWKRVGEHYRVRTASPSTAQCEVCRRLGEHVSIAKGDICEIWVESSERSAVLLGAMCSRAHPRLLEVGAEHLSPLIATAIDDSKRRQETLDWVVLPPGWWNDPSLLRVLLDKMPTSRRQLLVERVRFVDSLEPQMTYRSAARLGGAPYLVFLFGRCAIAECPEWGNALYLLRDKRHWRDIFGRTKLAVRRSSGVVVIQHRGDWKNRLRLEMRELGEVIPRHHRLD